jgi:5'-nucleotidase (lipoprotein e(P4) family)
MKLNSLSSGIIGLILGMSSVVTFQALAENQDLKQLITGKELNDQSLLALNWVQQSGEYKALSYQAFNMAKIAFDHAISQGVKNPAVVVDLDETLLDNSAYQASFIGQDQGYSNTTWNQWVQDAEAKALPGAVEFVNYINMNGGKVFFVSNRNLRSTKSGNNDLEKATIYNLKQLGFSGVDETTVVLEGEFTKNINNQVSTAKEWRRQAITNGLVDGINHTIVILVGDNLNDLSDSFENTSTNNEKLIEVEKLKQQFAFSRNTLLPTFIVIPNPLYGSWESGLYDPQKFNVKKWYELTPEQKDQERRESLIIWNNN